MCSAARAAREVFRVQLVSGTGAVTGRGQGAELATVYTRQMVGDSAQCRGQPDPAAAVPPSPATAPADSLTVGVSCCPAPANLGTVWVQHSRPLLSALNSLHGKKL